MGDKVGMLLLERRAHSGTALGGVTLSPKRTQGPVRDMGKMQCSTGGRRRPCSYRSRQNAFIFLEGLCRQVEGSRTLVCGEKQEDLFSRGLSMLALSLSYRS